ncbi:MAG: hypothetical protein GY810_32495 [Aureispira sp.]|nr:hypothetical protein [Aureispira sp.]
MNVPDENIHTLIHALTKSEKRYFKLFVKNIGGKAQTNYIKLFDAIVAQSEYNEAKIKKKFDKEKFVKQLSVTKHYLFKLILKSLLNFHNDHIETEIYDGLKQVRILYDKQLFDIALHQLERLQKLALDNDKIVVLPIIAEWLLSLQNTHFAYQKYDLQQFDNLVRFGEDYIATFRAQYQYLVIWSRLCFYSRKVTYSRKIRTIAAANIENPLLQELPQESFRSQILFHSILAISHQICAQYKESLKHIVALLKLFEDNPNLQMVYNREYTTTLGNGIVLTNRMQEWDLLDKILEQAQQAKTSTRMSYITLQICIYNAALPRLEIYGTVEAIENKVKEVDSFLHEEWEAIPPAAQMTLCFFIARIWFALEKYDRVIIYLEKVLAHNKKLLPTVHSSAKILLLLTHNEQGEHLMLPYAVRSTYRYLKHKEGLFEFEKIMLNFLKKSIDLVNEVKFDKGLKQLQEKIFALMEEGDSAQLEPLLFFDYISWIDSKLTNRSFMEVMRERHQDK